MKTLKSNPGFSLVELAIGVVVLGVILLVFSSAMLFVQKSSSQTMNYTDAQQNARAALDYLTETLRASGSAIDFQRGQPAVAHAGPYQVVINADLDHGQIINGEAPLTSISVSYTPSTVPASGSIIYSPGETYDSDAETIVLTLDSDNNGVVNASDRGDDAEENLKNNHLYVIKRHIYGYESGTGNKVRTASLGIVRGPVTYPDGSYPPPLFSYYYDHDNDLSTADRLWGDTSLDGKLNDAEIGALTDMPAALLFMIHKIEINVVSESFKFDSRYEDNEGFLTVSMKSQVYLRNMDRNENSRISGLVYFDANANGVQDKGEQGIPGVTVKVPAFVVVTKTDSYGKFSLRVEAGTFDVVEVDLIGHLSSTPNVISVTLVPGELALVEFGDYISGSYGFIQGEVFNDVNENGYRDGVEVGVADVLIELDAGPVTKTASDGSYLMTMPTGSYTVTEMDLNGWRSTTPHSVPVTIASSGDTAYANFGDVEGLVYGTLEGHVYLDENRNASWDFGEPGLSDVSIDYQTGIAVTNASGFYTAQLLPGLYDITEIDNTGYTSTTANNFPSVSIIRDSTVTFDFGDIHRVDLDFIDVLISDTERPLNVAVGDFGEDTNGDVDIVLGTASGAMAGNVHIYQNGWAGSGSRIADLFGSAPTYSRNAGSDVSSVLVADVNGDGRIDVATGIQRAVGFNVQVWPTDTKGVLLLNPVGSYLSGSSSYVTEAKAAFLNGDAMIELIVGQKSSLGAWTGGVGISTVVDDTLFVTYQQINEYQPTYPLGKVTCVDTGDLDNDGDLDLAIGSNNGEYSGHIDIFLNDSTGVMVWNARYVVQGRVNDIHLVDLVDNAFNRVDLLVAVATKELEGGMQYWYNSGTTFGRPDTSGYSFGAFETANVATEYFETPNAEALYIEVGWLDADIFPDIALGTRTSLFYTGDLWLLQPTDSAPTKVTLLSSGFSYGEAVSIAMADFNKDSIGDIVVATRTSLSTGSLAIYYGDTPPIP